MNTETKGGNSPPSLWNPNAAAVWSLLFTPIFGASIHAINWQALGEEVKAKQSILWALGCIATMVMAYFLPPLAANLANILYLFIWYFISAKRQVDHVEIRLKNSYTKRGWAKPLIIAIAILSVCVVAIIESIQEDESIQQQPRDNNDMKGVDKTAKHYVYAHDLYKKIGTNAAAAKNEYSNDYIRISGILNSIQGWGTADFALIIDNGENIGEGVYCLFGNDYATQLNHLKAGAEINIKGRVRNYSVIGAAFGVEMQDCSITQ
jgi:tRNA_anti-like